MELEWRRQWAVGSWRPATRALANCFGLCKAFFPEASQRVHIPVMPGDIVLFTGPSGGGKSLLLGQAIRHVLAEVGAERVVCLEEPEEDRGTVVESLGLPVADAARLLTRCGMGEPRLWLGPGGYSQRWGTCARGRGPRLCTAQLCPRQRRPSVAGR